MHLEKTVYTYNAYPRFFWLPLGDRLLLLCIIPHLLLDLADYACTAIDHSSVYLCHTRSRIEDLSRLPTICDAARCEYNLAWCVWCWRSPGCRVKGHCRC